LPGECRYLRLAGEEHHRGLREIPARDVRCLRRRKRKVQYHGREGSVANHLSAVYEYLHRLRYHGKGGQRLSDPFLLWMERSGHLEQRLRKLGERLPGKCRRG